MADIYLAGDAQATAQVRAATITAYDAATSYRVTINGKIVAQTGTGGTTTTTATAAASTLNASTIPEFAEITWSSNGADVIGTMDTPGKSWTCTSSVSGGAGTMGAFADTTANDGPSVLIASNCKNAATAARALPVNSDTFTVESLTSDLLYALDALSGVTLAGLYLEASMTGESGLHPINEDGSVDYSEYRPRYFAVGATECIIGAGDGDGSGFLAINFGSVLTTCTVLKSASPALDGYHAVIVKGTHASNVLKIESGSVDVAPFAGEVSTFATVTVVGDGQLRTAGGVAVGTVNAGGTSIVEITSAAALADITAINIKDSATVTTHGDNAITAVTIDGESATLNLLSSGEVATINLYSDATLDTDDNPTGVTVATINVFGPCTINDRNSKLAVTNAIANWSQVTFNGGPKRAVTLSAP